MRYLTERMNTPVCPAGAVQFKIACSENGFHGADQFPLDRSCIFLHLPAAEPCSFVFDVKFKTRHDAVMEPSAVFSERFYSF
jgi:hypothetical protein